MAHTEKQEVLLGGGVAANSRLREMVQIMAEDRGAQCYVPEKSVCIDNGAMIAWLGFLMYNSGVRMNIDETTVDQRFRTDMVEVIWRE
jgi:N6-L-threonylcarbamoyladenine synthase/N6-L-threonylcarbamoyladenine synthase/protein kinase Bud32